MECVDIKRELGVQRKSQENTRCIKSENVCPLTDRVSLLECKRADRLGKGRRFSNERNDNGKRLLFSLPGGLLCRLGDSNLAAPAGGSLTGTNPSVVMSSPCLISRLNDPVNDSRVNLKCS